MHTRTFLLGLVLCAFASAASAANDPACAEHDRLRSQRDKALSAKDFKAYCSALAGLIRLMPARPPAQAQLQCEAKATNMKVDTWLGVRPSVLETMTETFAQQCR